ncbi:MAG TPA: DUF4124 domain-containing protein [Gammaproteobacteria bacterium]|nr:DUF4124 domain-containing protein [Gammaproteobacteria bacterium]
MKSTPALIILLALLGTYDTYAEAYRWTDDKGNTVFGDKPPKNKTATAVPIDNKQNTGTRFADPVQVKDFERKATQSRDRRSIPPTRIDPYCRRYISELNKVEIFLEHTDTEQDRQKARDLRKLIDKECGNEVLDLKFDDGRCTHYRKELSKTEIFLEHSPNEPDEHKVRDLKKQIARECR